MATIIAVLSVTQGACDGCGAKCGPQSGVVAEVIDGDTIELDSGERIRYLLVDTPEISGDVECFGPEARDFNIDLVLGKKVDLYYDLECEDRYGRLLAYVRVDGREVNSLLVERGYACVLYIPPSGEDRVEEFEALQDSAEAANRGMWGVCEGDPC
jgi:micrococcal nuclease